MARVRGKYRTTTARASIGSKARQTSAAGKAAFDSSKNGMAEIIKALNDFIKQLKGVTPEILAEALEPTLGKSLQQVPVKDGHLKASAFLETRNTSTGATAVIGYAKGNNPPYAVFVHEIPARHAPPTKYKFLQDPLDEDYYSILSNLPRLIRQWAGT